LYPKKGVVLQLPQKNDLGGVPSVGKSALSTAIIIAPTNYAKYLELSTPKERIAYHFLDLFFDGVLHRHFCCGRF